MEATLTAPATTHPRPEARPEDRSRALDILRATAVFLVLGRHMPDDHSDNQTLLTFLRTWFQGGWIGVDLFFVLSGFLVSGLLFKEHQRTGHINFKVFWIRRAFRIYPPFLLLIAFSSVIMTLKDRSVPVSKILAELFFVQNYFDGLWLHTWSLAVEEHFYLLLPIFLIALSKLNFAKTNPFTTLPVAFACLAFLSLALRIRNIGNHSFDIREDVFLSHLRLDSLFLGVVLSYFSLYQPIRFQKFARRFATYLIAIGAAFLTWPFFFALEDTRWISSYGFTILYLASGALLVGLLGIESSLKSPPFKALAHLGAHSYSIYLWHIPIVRWVVPRVFNEQAPILPRVLLYLSLSIVVGIAFSKIVEIPLLKLRDRLFPSCVRARP